MSFAPSDRERELEIFRSLLALEARAQEYARECRSEYRDHGPRQGDGKSAMTLRDVRRAERVAQTVHAKVYRLASLIRSAHNDTERMLRG